MANKSVALRGIEDRLSLAHGHQSDALDQLGMAAVVTAQIFNRWPQALTYIQKLDAIHRQALNSIDRSQQIIRDEIDLTKHPA